MQSHVQVSKLAVAEADRLMRSCTVPAGADGPGAGVDAVTHESISREELRVLMQKVFVRFSAVDSIPDYETIAIPRFRVAVSQGVCESLVNCYQALHSKYLDQGGQAGDVKGPEQIATLLGI